MHNGRRRPFRPPGRRPEILVRGRRQRRPRRGTHLWSPAACPLPPGIGCRWRRPGLRHVTTSGFAFRPGMRLPGIGWPNRARFGPRPWSGHPRIRYGTSAGLAGRERLTRGQRTRHRQPLVRRRHVEPSGLRRGSALRIAGYPSALLPSARFPATRRIDTSRRRTRRLKTSCLGTSGLGSGPRHARRLGGALYPPVLRPGIRRLAEPFRGSVGLLAEPFLQHMPALRPLVLVSRHARTKAKVIANDGTMRPLTAAASSTAGWPDRRPSSSNDGLPAARRSACRPTANSASEVAARSGGSAERPMTWPFSRFPQGIKTIKTDIGGGDNPPARLPRHPRLADTNDDMTNDQRPRPQPRWADHPGGGFPARNSAERCSGGCAS